MPGYALQLAPERAVEGPLWRTLAGATGPASVAELHHATRAHPNAIQHRLSRWVLAGLVTRIEGSPKRFAMNENVERSAEPPRVDRAGRVTTRRLTARDRMWKAMRVLKRFDLPTLQIAAAASRRSAEDYVNCLTRSGHLRMAGRGNPQQGTWSTYAVARNTGPKSPQVAHSAVPDGRLREVVDRNTGARIDISPRAVSLRSKASPAAADGGVG